MGSSTETFEIEVEDNSYYTGLITEILVKVFDDKHIGNRGLHKTIDVKIDLK